MSVKDFWSFTPVLYIIIQPKIYNNVPQNYEKMSS